MTEAYAEDGRLWFPMPELGARSRWIEKDPETLAAWTRLWSKAARWEQSDQFRGRPVPLEIGQLVTTYLGFAELMGWSRNRVRSFLGQLVKCGELRINARTYDPKMDTWKDSKSDTGLLLLTLVCHPFRPKASFGGTGEKTAKRTADLEKGQEKDRERTGKKDSEKDSEKDSGFGAPSTLCSPKAAPEKDSGSDREKDTSPKPAEAVKRTRFKQQQQNTLPEPSESSGDTSVRSVIEEIGLTLLPGGRREGGGDSELRPPDPRHPALGKPHPHRARELLSSIGMAPGFAREVSVRISLGRVFDVVSAARGREKPGGWARVAFEEGFVVDEPPAEELEALKAELDQECAAAAKRAAGLGDVGRHRGPRAGESAEDYLLRINQLTRASQLAPPAPAGGEGAKTEEDGRKT